jgi:hypothetical protein
MTRARELIKAGAAVLLRWTPFGGDGTLLLKPQQNRIECALIHREQVAADLLDAPGDAVAVQRASVPCWTSCFCFMQLPYDLSIGLPTGECHVFICESNRDIELLQNSLKLMRTD